MSTHQGPPQLLCPVDIHPALPRSCQAPGLLGRLELAKQGFRPPALNVLPPVGRACPLPREATDLGLLDQAPAGVDPGWQRAQLWAQLP